MSSPWSDNIFTYFVSKVSSKKNKKAMAASSDFSSSSVIQGHIACLIHLYKYPGAQMHWTNYYGVLSRAQLDARKSTGVQAEVANVLSCLAALYNDYEGFTPQNAMMAYVYKPTMNHYKKSA
jgi:hypothetical protein